MIMLFCADLTAQNTITLGGTIANSNADKVYIWRYRDFISYEKLTIDSAKLDYGGNFSMHFESEKPFAAILEVGNEITDIYLNPGDQLQVNVDASNFDKSLEYYGTGDIINNYLAKKVLRTLTASQDNNKAAKLLDESGYAHYMDSINSESMGFFTKYLSQYPDITPGVMDFMAFEINSLTFSCVKNKLSYPSYHRYLNKLPQNYKVSDSYYDFLKTVNFDNQRAVNCPSYIEAAEGYIHYTFRNI